jgi:hypothetical protein
MTQLIENTRRQSLLIDTRRSLRQCPVAVQYYSPYIRRHGNSVKMGGTIADDFSNKIE